MTGIVEVIIRKSDATEAEADAMKVLVDQVRSRIPSGFSVLIRFMESREVVK